MSIRHLELYGFRSIRHLHLPLDQLNIVVGPNGCGKTNLYKAVRLLHEAANGTLSAALAVEGGISHAMWAGPLRRDEKKRMILSATLQDFDYELQLGYPSPSASLFTLDPLVKQETLWVSGQRRRPSARVMIRTNQNAILTTVDGIDTPYPLNIQAEESIFGQLTEPHRYPELSSVRHTLQQWRFYHEFAIWPDSPLRQPQISIRSPVLAHDGRNLAAAFQTIIEIGDHVLLHSILQQAFPDCHFMAGGSPGILQMQMERNGIRRPLDAAELSDGTLRFLCLAVALLSPRPPAMMALNEPENSLHPDLLPALAKLLAEASRHSQLWITSHSPALANAIARHQPVRRFLLDQEEGATVVKATDWLG